MKLFGLNNIIFAVAGKLKKKKKVSWLFMVLVVEREWERYRIKHIGVLIFLYKNRLYFLSTFKVPIKSFSDKILYTFLTL